MDLNKWVVLQEPNQIKQWYYVWRESTYDKKPNRGFVSKIEAQILADNLNNENKWLKKRK